MDESLPSSTIALMDDSSTGDALHSDLQPRRHKMELLSKAKLTLVLMYPMTSENGSADLSLIFCAILVITLLADGPAPPVVAKTSGLKELCSTFVMRCSYFSFFSDS